MPYLCAVSVGGRPSTTNLRALRKNKEAKMTRRYLHPANGRCCRNAGVDEQILLYPDGAQFIPNSLYSPFQHQKSEGSRKMVAFGFLSDSQIIPLNQMTLFVCGFPCFSSAVIYLGRYRCDL